MAQKIDDEGHADVFCDTLVREQLANIEEVARMLPVQRGQDLASIQIGEGSYLQLGKAQAASTAGVTPRT